MKVEPLLYISLLCFFILKILLLHNIGMQVIVGVLENLKIYNISPYSILQALLVY